MGSLSSSSCVVVVAVGFSCSSLVVGEGDVDKQRNFSASRQIGFDPAACKCRVLL